MNKLFSIADKISNKLAAVKTYKQDDSNIEELISEEGPDTDPSPPPQIPQDSEYTLDDIEEKLEDESLSPQEREYWTNKWQMLYEQSPTSSKPVSDAVPATEPAGAWMPNSEPISVIISIEDRDILMEAFYVLLNHESDNPNMQKTVESILNRYKGGVSNPNVKALKDGINKLLDKLQLNKE